MDNLIKKLSEDITYKECGNGYILSTPIMYKYADHTFSFYVEKTATGSYIISDRGQTIDYMRENFDPKAILDKIEGICERYGITYLDGEFSCHISQSQTARNFYNYIAALNMIANIDCL